MKITTKENAAGRSSAYYINGQRVKKSEIDLHIQDAARAGEIIDVDYYTAKQFRAITRSPYNLKVVFGNVYGKCLMTEAAAIDLGATIVKRFTGFNSLKVYEFEMPTAKLTVRSAREQGLSFEEFIAASNGLSLDEYRQRKEREDHFYALKSKIDNLQSDIRHYERENYRTARNIYGVVNDSLFDSDESLKDYAVELEAEINTNLAKIADAKAQLATLEPAFAAETDLAMQAANDADLDDYVVSTDAQQVAVDAETELAEQAAALATETHNYPDTNLTANQKLAAQIVAKLGNLIVKCESGEFGTRNGQILHYDTYADEHDEFGTTLFIVEVFTDDTSYILDHVNLIKGYGDNKTIETYYFVNTNDTNDTTDAGDAPIGTDSANDETQTAVIQAEHNADPPNDLSDSLVRAMKIVLEKSQEFCRAKDIKSVQAEMKLYTICAKALTALVQGGDGGGNTTDSDRRS